MKSGVTIIGSNSDGSENGNNQTLQEFKFGTILNKEMLIL